MTGHTVLRYMGFRMDRCAIPHLHHARFCLQQPHTDPCGAAASWHERARSIRSCILKLTPLALCAGFHVLDQATKGGEEACGVSGTA